AQYRELAAFAQFASDLDKATRDQLTRGERLTYVLRQPQAAPVPVEQQVAIIWAATNGHLDDVEVAKIAEFEAGLYRFLESTHADLLPAIAREKALSDELIEQLTTAVKEFKRQAGYGKADDAAPLKEPPRKESEAKESEADSAA
ncbi:MAG: F0F1 ATP synthase subunit alpha, partial [Candidatus Limnocylindria bacterium]